MKGKNPALTMGLIIMIFLMLLSLFPQWFTSKSPYTLQLIRSSIEQGELDFQRAPYPPSPDFPLGSDDFGRDLWTLIAYGVRLTLTLSLLIVMGRFLIALPLALAAGFGNLGARSIIKQFSLLYSAIPALLISIIILKQEIFLSLNKGQSMAAFIIVLTLVGWSKLGNLMLERTEDIMKRPFIRSEIAIGKKNLNIALGNVLPHMMVEIIVFFFMEIAAALSLLMQLGIFGVYVGNLKIIKDTEGGVIKAFNISFEPEWASILGSARTMIHNAPWMVIVPALFFFMAVLGFNLIGEGLRSQLQGEEKRKALIFKRPESSPLTRRVLSIMAGISAVCLAAFIIMPRQHFDTENIDMTAYPEEQVIIGTENARDVSLLIARNMEALGLSPLKTTTAPPFEDFIFEYEIEPLSLPVSSSMISGSGEKAIQMTRGVDYSFINIGSFTRSGFVYNASLDDLLSIRDYGRFKDIFVLIDKEFYSDESIKYICKQLAENTMPLGILLVKRPGESISIGNSSEGETHFVIEISRETADIILSRQDQLTVSAESRTWTGPGRNIVGVLRGRDPVLNEEAIIINMPYNYNDSSGRSILQFYLSVMEALCTGRENRRSYIFIFPDGPLGEERNGLVQLMQNFPWNTTDLKVSIDLSRIRKPSFNTVSFNSQQAPITRYFAWSLAHMFEAKLKKAKIPISEIPSEYRGEFYFSDIPSSNVMFWTKGIPCIALGSHGEIDATLNLSKLGAVLIETIEMNNY